VLNGSVDPAEGGYMPLGRRYGFLFRNNRSEEELLHTLAHELGHGLFTLRHTFSTSNRFYQPQTSTDNLMSYGPPTATRLYKYQWDAIQNPSLALFSWMEREEEGEFGGRLTILDKKHTLLFNHIYSNNREGNLKYHEKIAKALAENPREESIELEYLEQEEKEWINQWKLRTSSSDQILEKIIKKIQKASKGEKIERMTLKAKGIYIGKYKLNDVEYPIAIYSKKDIIDNITKVQVSEISELEKEENRKHLRAEETFIKYLVIAFYEEGSNEPVLMMQIEKFDISKLQNTKEKWLTYLVILNEEKTKTDSTDIIVDATWIGQFSSEINGRDCHWCSSLGKCCNGGAPCSKCPNDDSKDCCNIECIDTTLVNNCDSCKLGKICDTKTCKSNNCCYQASLAIIEKFKVTTNRTQAMDIATLINNMQWRLQSDLQANSSLFKSSLTYIDTTLKAGKPVIIGVHYSNDKNGTYNSNNATFHFMVIVGKVHKNDKVYYRFYDPGRTIEIYGKSETNLLEIDMIKEMIHCLYNNKIYTVTEVRKNLQIF